MLSKSAPPGSLLVNITCGLSRGLGPGARGHCRTALNETEIETGHGVSRHVAAGGAFAAFLLSLYRTSRPVSSRLRRLLWWRESILWVAFMSLYANVASHWSTPRRRGGRAQTGQPLSRGGGRRTRDTCRAGSAASERPRHPCPASRDLSAALSFHRPLTGSSRATRISDRCPGWRPPKRARLGGSPVTAAAARSPCARRLDPG
jgi:hypothetical protein